MQGFFNFLVYVRPKYLNWRKNFPTRSRLWALKQATLALENSKKHKKRQEENDERITGLQNLDTRTNAVHASFQDDIRNMVVEIEDENPDCFSVDDVSIDRSKVSDYSDST